MVNENANGRYNLRSRKVVAGSPTLTTTGGSTSGDGRKGWKRRGKRNVEVVEEVDLITKTTPRKRSVRAAELEDGDQTSKRHRSPEILPPTPQSERARSLITRLEATLESKTTPPLSETAANALETPSLSRHADAAAQTEPFETPTFPKVQNAFTVPTYYPKMPAVQEPYVGGEQSVGNIESTGAVDMTASPLYDSSITPSNPWQVVPMAPTILSAGGTSTEMGFMAPGALGGPFQYQESAERFYRPSEAQFEFARNLQQTIATESPHNEPLDLLAGVANNLNEQRVVREYVSPRLHSREDLDLTEVVRNLFVGSYCPFTSCSHSRSSVFVPENFERFTEMGIGPIYAIGTEEEIRTEWNAKVMNTIYQSDYFHLETVPISDEPTSRLLGYLRDLCDDLDSLVQGGQRVSVHW
jgi:hypothetical protein